MLWIINALVGFAAVFALFSLLVTGIVQGIRVPMRMKNRYVIERLLRLFGELKEPRRFAAAVLSHPTLEGQRGVDLYLLLTNPQKPNTSPEVRAAVSKVLGSGGWLSWFVPPWPRSADLDKQTLKDIGQTVYERIGPLVDYTLAETVQNDSFAWAPVLAQKLAEADTASQGGVIPFRGRMWALATAAFPEGGGAVPPLKTYIAAFDDEAAASASDRFTMAVRWLTLVVALVVSFAFQLDGVGIWDNFVKLDPTRIENFAQAAIALSGPSTIPATPGEAGPGATDNARELGEARQKIVDALKVLQEAPLKICFLGHEFPEPEKGPSVRCTLSALDPRIATRPGFFLAVVALTLGAPFWFEILKGAIDLKSAFTKDTKK